MDINEQSSAGPDYSQLYVDSVVFRAPAAKPFLTAQMIHESSLTIQRYQSKRGSTLVQFMVVNIAVTVKLKLCCRPSGHLMGMIYICHDATPHRIMPCDLTYSYWYNTAC